MELVYLWMEEYKNIKQQGFNFSPRFTCKFHDEYEKDEDGEERLKENCVLEIKENSDYVNIFPKNINVTAIVGENGGGKSNLLELISDVGYYEDPHSGKEYPRLSLDLVQLTVYYDRLKNKLYLYKKNLTAMINNKSSITEEEITSEAIQKILIRSTPSHSQQEYLLLLDFLINNNIDFPFDMPEIISFGTHDDFYNLLESIKNESFDFYTYYTPFEENQTIRLKIFHILLLLAYLKNYKIDFDIQASKNYDTTILELEDKVDETIKSKVRSFIQTPLEDFSVTTSHYVNIKKIPNDFFKIYMEIIKRKNDDTLLDFKGKNVFNFDLYPKMSDGQYQLTYIFSNIYSQLNQDSIVLCIDEGENYLHPNWQKKYINYLYQFLKDNFSNKQIHLILTSHSPFILSDLPKENVIFLKNGAQVYPDIQTFGANIHTLLSHGFFMEDGLMGEFAKEKINEAIAILNKQGRLSKSSLAYCEQIISIIGEPILKRQLQKMLDGKRLTRIDDINNKIKDMEYELSILKKYQKKATLELKDRAKRKHSKKKQDD